MDITADTSNCGACGSACGSGMRTVLILDGLAQLTGAILLGWGLSSSVKVQVRNDVVAKVNVAPTKIGTGYGLGAAGTF